MFYCNFQVLLCTEIAVQKDFAPQNMTSSGAPGGLKNFQACYHFPYLWPPHKL